MQDPKPGFLQSPGKWLSRLRYSDGQEQGVQTEVEGWVGLLENWHRRVSGWDQLVLVAHHQPISPPTINLFLHLNSLLASISPIVLS